MSSILKALEKVEQAQSTKRSGGPSGLVRSKQRRPAWVLPVGVGAGALVAFLITFAAMGGFSKHRSAAPPAQVAATEAPAAAVSAKTVDVAPPAVVPAPVQAAAVPAPKAAPQPAAAVKVTPPAGKPVKAATVLAAHPAPAAAAKKKAHAGAATTLPVAKAAVKKTPAAKVAAAKNLIPPRVVQGKSVRRVAAVPAPPAATLALIEAPAAPAAHPAVPAPAASAPSKPAVTAAPQAAPAKSRSEIRVTGIAWQNDSESSAVIVNGHMVAHGGSVDGFKVEKIFEDKVRFSGKNGTVDVPLTAGD